MLQGWNAHSAGAQRLQAHYRNGPFAEQILIPMENAARRGPITGSEAARWCWLNTLLVPYGGLLAAGLQAGETVLISGATGHFGSAGIAVALAMGATCVIAPGRNQATLESLALRFGSRVRTVALTGQENQDRERMQRAASGPIDRGARPAPADLRRHARARGRHDDPAARHGGAHGRRRRGGPGRSRSGCLPGR